MYQAPEVDKAGALRAAVKAGDITRVQALLQDTSEWPKEGALKDAVEYAQVEIVRTLLAYRRPSEQDAKQLLKSVIYYRPQGRPPSVQELQKNEQIAALLLGSLADARREVVLNDVLQPHFRALSQLGQPQTAPLHLTNAFHYVFQSLSRTKELAQLSTEALIGLTYEILVKAPSFAQKDRTQPISMPSLTSLLSRLRRTFETQLTVPSQAALGKGLKDLAALAPTSKEVLPIPENVFFHILSYLAPELRDSVLKEVWNMLHTPVRYQTRLQLKGLPPGRRLQQRMLGRVTDEAYRLSVPDVFQKCKALYADLERIQAQGPSRYALSPRQAWELSFRVSWLKLAMEELNGALSFDVPAVAHAQERANECLADYEKLVKTPIDDKAYQMRAQQFRALRWVINLHASELYRLVGEERFLEQPAQEAPSAGSSSRKRLLGKEPEVCPAAKRGKGIEL